MLSKALALHLHGLGLVRYPPDSPGNAVPCYVEEFPADSAPDDLVLIRLEPGFPATDTSGYETPELRVLRRTAASAGWQAGYDGAMEIRRAVHGTGQVTWAAGTEHEVHVVSCDADDTGPVREGQDPKGRPVWSCSFAPEIMEVAA